MAAPVQNRSILAMVRTKLRPMLIEWRRLYLNKVWGMDIGRGATISLQANLDKTFPQGIHIGEDTAVNFDAVILTHDFINGYAKHHTRIGRCCHIGARSVIMPGITVGDHSIVAVASVVMKNVPPNSLVAGNPARVIEAGIQTGPRGIRILPAKAEAVPGPTP
jgi:acetyltransferase-like isoleucine patch superfamily enzyme